MAIKEPLFDPHLSKAVIEEMGQRFVVEGRAAARLNHPGIVTIYAADVYDGHPAIVMELIEGETLSSLLRSGPLNPSVALSITDQLLDAVGYAHEQDVVHRDIKPENIFVTSAGTVKLADFGIARDERSANTMGTVAGAVLGTPGYMSPEQATGSRVDARSDLFSVGVVAYEMFAGSNPFGAGEGADVATLLYRTVHEPAPDLPYSLMEGLPVDVRPAIMKALSKSPDDRPQSAREFRRMLHQYAIDKPDEKEQAHTLSSWLPIILVALLGVIVLGFVSVSSCSSMRGTATDDSPGSVAGAEANQATVSFEGGKATGSGNEAIDCRRGDTITLPACEFTRDGYKFVGWKERESGEVLSPGDTWLVEREETVFVAKWKSTSVLKGAVASLKSEGHTYAIFDTDCDWYTAESACESRGGHLATITSSLEQSVIENLIIKGSRNTYWLGGYLAAPGVWQWVAGEPFGYSNWAEGAPDNWIVEGRDGGASEAERNDISIAENAIVMYRVKNPNAPHELGGWNDLASNGDCNGEAFFGLANIGYVCEWDEYVE